jgi:hypothetical protein
LISPNWLPTGLIQAVNGLIDCTTSPDSGSLNVGMRGSLFAKVLALVARHSASKTRVNALVARRRRA